MGPSLLRLRKGAEMSTINPVLIAGGVASSQTVYEVVVGNVGRHRPGTQGVLADGRTFEYVRSDQGTAIGKGKLATYEPMAAGSDQLAPTAAGIGATTIIVSVTLTLTKDELIGGFVTVDSTPGEGEMYGITGHALHTSGNLTLQLERPIVTALTTGSDLSIVHGPASVKISAAVALETEAQEVPAGVPLVDIPVGNVADTHQFFWIQKTGFANVLFGDKVGSVGDSLGFAADDAGAFSVSVEKESVAQLPELGQIVALLPVDTEYAAVMLHIA